MIQHTFERYEKKYMLDAAQYKAVRAALSKYMEVDRFGKSAILNIYFDTPDYRLIRASLEKPVYKEKLRLRSYGVPGDADTVFVEIKKKFKGVVYKRRAEAPLNAAMNWLAGGARPGEGQIEREIDYALSLYRGIRPAMAISYERTALYGIDDPALRVTFDQNILFREENLDLRFGASGEGILESGYRLMEVKLAESMPKWLADILAEADVYPTSFSKYGAAYIISAQRRLRGGVLSA